MCHFRALLRPAFHVCGRSESDGRSLNRMQISWQAGGAAAGRADGGCLWCLRFQSPKCERKSCEFVSARVCARVCICERVLEQGSKRGSDLRRRRNSAILFATSLFGRVCVSDETALCAGPKELVKMECRCRELPSTLATVSSPGMG